MITKEYKELNRQLKLLKEFLEITNEDGSSIQNEINPGYIDKIKSLLEDTELTRTNWTMKDVHPFYPVVMEDIDSSTFAEYAELRGEVLLSLNSKILKSIYKTKIDSKLDEIEGLQKSIDETISELIGLSSEKPVYVEIKSKEPLELVVLAKPQYYTLQEQLEAEMAKLNVKLDELESYISKKDNKNFLTSSDISKIEEKLKYEPINQINNRDLYKGIYESRDKKGKYIATKSDYRFFDNKLKKWLYVKANSRLAAFNASKGVFITIGVQEKTLGDYHDKRDALRDKLSQLSFLIPKDDKDLVP